MVHFALIIMQTAALCCLICSLFQFWQKCWFNDRGCRLWCFIRWRGFAVVLPSPCKCIHVRDLAVLGFRASFCLQHFPGPVRCSISVCQCFCQTDRLDGSVCHTLEAIRERGLAWDQLASSTVSSAGASASCSRSPSLQSIRANSLTGHYYDWLPKVFFVTWIGGGLWVVQGISDDRESSEMRDFTEMIIFATTQRGEPRDPTTCDIKTFSVDIFHMFTF